MAAQRNNEQFLFVEYVNALSLPLKDKCSKLTSLLETLSQKELKCLFGRLVEEIFGFHTKQDWGLLTLDTSDRDHEVLKRFLSVEGPVMRSCYKLLEDPNAQFEYHIANLPAPSRQCLQEGKVPQFYSNKIYAMAGGAISSSYLLLNSFEFFLFHFAYYIANPTWKGYSSTVNQMDTVYTSLLEEYLKYFLPFDGTPAPVLSSSAKTLSPSKTFHSQYQRNTSWNLGQSIQGTSQSPYDLYPYLQPKQRPNLLKPGVLEMLYSIPELNSQGVPPLGASKSEIWRSEELLSILSEMYLNQGTTKQVQSIAGFLKERYLPSHYHVYMVRVLIKHVHYFANSFVPSMHILNGSPFALDLLGELKSIVLPRLIQKNLCSFLQLTFSKWPLDNSFRVPLETWLSYIQPWRYTDAKTRKEEEEKGFVNRWIKFVIENLHFYTPFLSQVLHRFSRMDLCCPKTAYMLFRTTKVFSQPDLDTMICKAEKHHLAVSQSTSRSPYTVSQYAASYSNEKSMLNSQESQSSASRIGCQELFDRNLIIQVSQLVRKIVATKEEAKSMKLVSDNAYEGFFSKLFSSGADSRNIPAEEYSPPDSKKLILHLESSVNNLCKLFNLTPPTNPELSNETTSQDQSAAEQSKNLSTRKTPVKNLSQLRPGIPADMMKYQGNPDLQPVRSYEYEILVKALTDASAFFNEKYAEEIKELYFRPTLFGRMCQQVLAAPYEYIKITKCKSMKAPSVEKIQLPPRIYLRFLANKHVIWYSFLYFLLMHYLGGFHLLPSMIILMAMIITIVFFRALFFRVSS